MRSSKLPTKGPALPRRTPKRKRALALLQEWANEEREVELSVGWGFFFTGTLVQVSEECTCSVMTTACILI